MYQQPVARRVRARRTTILLITRHLFPTVFAGFPVFAGFIVVASVAAPADVTASAIGVVVRIFVALTPATHRVPGITCVPDVGNMPLAGVGVAGKVDDNVKCGGNSVLCSSFWHSCGKGQSEQAMGDVTGTISVDGGKASPVAGVECGKEVDGFSAAYFSAYNRVR